MIRKDDVDDARDAVVEHQAPHILLTYLCNYQTARRRESIRRRGEEHHYGGKESQRHGWRLGCNYQLNNHKRFGLVALRCVLGRQLDLFKGESYPWIFYDLDYPEAYRPRGSQLCAFSGFATTVATVPSRQGASVRIDAAAMSSPESVPDRPS